MTGMRVKRKRGDPCTAQRLAHGYSREVWDMLYSSFFSLVALIPEMMPEMINNDQSEEKK